MKAHLSRRYGISASHRLHSEAYTEEENASIYGKCNHPYGHGHNYVVEVTVSGPVDAVTGMVCNLAELDGCVQRLVIDRFDHRNLNADALFVKQVPTTENLCREIYRLVAENFFAANLERVRVEETSNNSFEFTGKA